MRRVLIIAYYFPPIGGIGSIRMASFASLLPQFGWEALVVAPGATPHPADPTLSFPENGVVRSRSIELSRLGRALPGRRAAGSSAGAPGGGGGMRAAVRAAAHRYVFYPDGQIGWFPGATVAGLRALRGGRFDAIYSSSNPITAHLVARTLGNISELPWVAEFRDPWSDRLPTDSPYKARAAKLEASIARSASRMVAPTPTLARLWGARWNMEVALIPNGHDLEGPSRARPERPTITHVGTYYPGRQNFRALWAALERLARSGRPDLPRLRFVGEMPGELRREVAAAGLDDLIEPMGLLPHEEAMRAMTSSTMLLAAGFAGEDPVSRGVIPAKLFEYLASGLPILYLGSADDDAGRLLTDQPGCHVVDPSDVDGVLAALDSGLSGATYERDAEQFSRRARARALARVLDDAVAERHAVSPSPAARPSRGDA